MTFCIFYSSIFAFVLFPFLEWPKAFYILHSLIMKSPYPIMPQSSAVHIQSRSSPLWIFFHLLSTFPLIYITLFRIYGYQQIVNLSISPFIPESVDIYYIGQILFHFFVSGLVVGNAFHLAQFPKIVAFLINFATLAILSYFLFWNDQPCSYFLILTLPIWGTVFANYIFPCFMNVHQSK
jgi:hypothetical protein